MPWGRQEGRSWRGRGQRGKKKLLGDGDVPYLGCSDALLVCIYIKTYQSAHFEYGQFITNCSSINLFKNKINLLSKEDNVQESRSSKSRSSSHPGVVPFLTHSELATSPECAMLLYILSIFPWKVFQSLREGPNLAR